MELFYCFDWHRVIGGSGSSSIGAILLAVIQADSDFTTEVQGIIQGKGIK